MDPKEFITDHISKIISLAQRHEYETKRFCYMSQIKFNNKI